MNSSVKRESPSFSERNTEGKVVINHSQSEPWDYPSFYAVVKVTRRSDGASSLHISIVSIISVFPCDSKFEWILRYSRLSRFVRQIRLGPCYKDILRCMEEHFRNVKAQVKYRIIKELELEDDVKSRMLGASSIVSSCICATLSDLDDISHLNIDDDDAGFIAHLLDQTCSKSQVQGALCPSPLLSVTLLPKTVDGWNQMPLLRQQLIKRSLIGRILLNHQEATIYLDVLEYDIATQSMRSYSFTVTTTSSNCVDGSSNYSFCIILPSTIISFLPPANSKQMNDESNMYTRNQDIFISEATQTLLDVITSTRFMLKQNKNHALIQGYGDISRAFIFTGPPGAGKTFSVQAVVNRLKNSTRFISIRGSELLSSSESATSLIHIFQSALDYCRKNEDVITLIFMDECDALFSSDTMGYIIGALLDQMSSTFNKMHGLTQAWRQIIVVAATNNIDAVPAYLRRPGRFDQEIAVKPPDSNARYVILKSLLIPYRDSCQGQEYLVFDNESDTTGNIDRDAHHIEMDDEETVTINPLNVSNNNLLQSAYYDTNGLRAISEACVGYVPADLSSLVRKAASLAAESNSTVLNTLHLTRAMRDTGASALRTATVPSIPKTTWDDIAGDSGGAKAALIRAVEWPRKKKKAFASLGLVPPRGILLYGPPGCAKTSLARAAAGSTGIAFFSFSPADVYSSSYVGDAEAVIRRAFSLARSASPCILFFDEIDAIIGCSSELTGEDDGGLASLRRGKGDGGSSAEVRVLSTFLNEMDGIDGSIEDGVLILAATNRPHTLDAALLRPGRFDKVIYVPPPEEEGRRMILEAQCKKWVKCDTLNINYLASDAVSANMTGAEIVGACREAAMMAIRDALTHEERTGVVEPIVKNHQLEMALRSVKPLLDDPRVMIPYLKFQSKA